MPIVDGWEATKLIREKERKEAQEKVSILSSASSAVFSTPKLILRSD
jgi:CheY-like chemotaxis protein